MRIGELAKISGLAPSRIRLYEASGLIKSVGRKANGYREHRLREEGVAAAPRGRAIASSK